jgi:5-(hydroxymethyl)furfural/furfural oxidase
MAYFDPRFHWTELKVTTQVVSHNNPEENRPPLRKYEQARVLGGGSSINGQVDGREQEFRGREVILSRDPLMEPIVEFNLLSDRRDLDRLMSGFRKMAALQLSAPLRAVTDKPFPASYSDRVRKIGVVNAKNRILTTIVAALMDGPAALRRYMIDRFVVEGFTFDEVMGDGEAMEAFVRKSAIGVWHASCSCRMGRPDDPMAVVDTQGRVRGVQGLRVVDASIFPVLPCANTNFPTLMAAEKIAEMMP